MVLGTERGDRESGTDKERERREITTCWRLDQDMKRTLIVLVSVCDILPPGMFGISDVDAVYCNLSLFCRMGTHRGSFCPSDTDAVYLVASSDEQPIHRSRENKRKCKK